MRLVHLMLLLCIAGVALFSCTTTDQSPALFTTGILKKQFFDIDPVRDATIHTRHGSKVQIPAGAFGGSQVIRVEIREAFTPAEILAAGMVTESNGRPLKSSGMIYINATTDDKRVELLKPIDISIPNPYYDTAMQVFKGVESDSGAINWVDPVPTDTTPQSQLWANGKALFQKCASCHNIFRDRTGPALANVENRGPWTNRKNLYDYIRNTAKWIATDPYVKSLKNRYGSQMTMFPSLTDKNIDAILYYINTEAKNPASDEMQIPVAAIAEPVAPVDQMEGYISKDSADIAYTPVPQPCKDDTVYLPLQKYDSSFISGDDEFTNTNSPTYTEQTIQPAESMEGLRGGFTDPIGTTGMYDFSIKTLGWYNIDAYVEGYAGTTVVNVTAELQGQYEPGMISAVYLFLPRNKTLSVGNNWDSTAKKVSYNKINGGVPLFVNDKAILFAFGSKRDKLYYGISEFKVTSEQTIPIIIRETTENEMRSALELKQMDGIDLGIEQKEMRIITPPCDSVGVSRRAPPEN